MWQKTRLPARTSLIINTYNQPRSLLLLFESIAGQDHPVDEIIIADDGSRRETFEVIERCQAQFDLPIKEIVTQENKGYRKGMILNKAVLSSRGQQLIFVDGDIFAPPHWLGRHIQSYRPMGYATGGYVRLTLDQSREFARQELNQRFWSGYLSRYRPGISHFKSNYKHFRRYLKDIRGILLGKNQRPRIRGGNFSVDRGLFFGVNGFDERFSGFSGVDADLRNRMNNYGGRPTSLINRAMVLHLHHGLESDEPNPRVIKNRIPIHLGPYASSIMNVWAEPGLTGHVRTGLPAPNRVDSANPARDFQGHGSSAERDRRAFGRDESIADADCPSGTAAQWR